MYQFTENCVRAWIAKRRRVAIIFMKIVLLGVLVFILTGGPTFYDKQQMGQMTEYKPETANRNLTLIRDLLASIKSKLDQVPPPVKEPRRTASTTDYKTVKFVSQEKAMQDRLINIRSKCAEFVTDPYWINLHQGGVVWTYKEKDLHYCMVPKVGCTFWKRMMRFLSKDVRANTSIGRPSDIDRIYVHYGPVKHLIQSSVQNPVVRMIMTTGNSFMFAREPYSRLWSAYIDKFFLPDFWRTDAKAVVNKLRPNGTEYEKSCANNVTFLEFLTFINLTSKYGLNEHWNKVHGICSPCHVKYDVIGKQETFGDDADYILTKFGLEHLKEDTTKLDMVYEEVTTLTRYNFNLEKAYRKECFNTTEVARRLWRAFQFNGYIHRNISFPVEMFQLEEFLTKPADVFIGMVFRTFDKQQSMGYSLKSQKREMMLEAYRDIPETLLTHIQEIYKYDFEIFDYEKQLF